MSVHEQSGICPACGVGGVVPRHSGAWERAVLQIALEYKGQGICKADGRALQHRPRKQRRQTILGKRTRDSIASAGM